MLALQNVAAQAREVVEAYGADIGAHPVGTGPYMLGEYRRSNRIVLVANPTYRESRYEPAGPMPEASQAVAAALKGRLLPLTSRVEVNIIEEGQARWLAFMNRELDFLDILPVEFTEQALDARGNLLPELAGGASCTTCCCGPTHGGSISTWRTRSSAATRRKRSRFAVRSRWATTTPTGSACCSKAAQLRRNGLIPPDIAGFDPTLKTQAQLYDPALARALLDRFNYKDRDGDGYRETPDGKPLAIERWSAPNSGSRQGDELWKKNMDAIGIRLVLKKDRVPELRKMAREGKIPMRSDGWNADYPDAENFMQLLYGGSGPDNNSRFNLPEFNALYERARTLPDSPERTKLFDRMTELVIAYAPLRFTLPPARGQRPRIRGWDVRAASDPLAVVAVHRHRSGAARADQVSVIPVIPSWGSRTACTSGAGRSARG